MKVFELPPGREVKAALETIHQIEQRGGFLLPCVLVEGLRSHLGAAGAHELIMTLMEADAITVDLDGIRLTPLGRRLRVDVRNVFGLADTFAANDVSAEPVRGNA